MLVALPPIDEPNDRRFMEELYEHYKRLMYNKALETLADPQDADDLIQDCLEQLIKNIGTLRKLNSCRLTSYIVTTIRNTAINMAKKQEVQSRYTFLTDFEELDPADPSTLPEEVLLSEELSAAFVMAFDKLPEEDRILLRGKYVQGLSDAELASILGCAPNSIRMKLTRARRRALRCIKEGDYFREQT